MDIVMDFVRDMLSKFDFAYMLSVNIVTYLVIKFIDAVNGPKAVPTWLKRTTAVLVGIIIGIVIILQGADKIVIMYSFFISLVSWDAIFKPILKMLGSKIDYKK